MKAQGQSSRCKSESACSWGMMQRREQQLRCEAKVGVVGQVGNIAEFTVLEFRRCPSIYPGSWHVLPGFESRDEPRRGSTLCQVPQHYSTTLNTHQPRALPSSPAPPVHLMPPMFGAQSMVQDPASQRRSGRTKVGPLLQADQCASSPPLRYTWLTRRTCTWR